jgi:hypothetical protein
VYSDEQEFVMKTPTKLGTAKRFPASTSNVVPPIFNSPNWKGAVPTKEEEKILARENNFGRIRRGF